MDLDTTRDLLHGSMLVNDPVGGVPLNDMKALNDMDDMLDENEEADLNDMNESLKPFFSTMPQYGTPLKSHRLRFGHTKTSLTSPPAQFEPMPSSWSAPSWQLSILQLEHRVDVQFQQVVAIYGQMNNDIRSEFGQAHKQLRARNGERYWRVTSALGEVLNRLEIVERNAPHVTTIEERVEQIIVCMGDISHGVRIANKTSEKV